MKISFVIPAYNEENNILPFFELLKNTLEKSKYDFEAVFVDDGSTDNTFEKMESLFSQNNNVKVISFSRNFGKDAAIYAGIKESSGDYTAIIDADLQQLPETVVKMADLLDNDQNISSVSAYQEYRNEPLLLAFFKKTFYRIINAFSKVEFRHDSSDFRIMRNDMKEAFLKIGDKVRFTKGIYALCGFNTAYIPYIPDKRYSGKSKWKFASLLSYALSGLFSFADKLFLVPAILGVAEILSSFIVILLYAIFKKITEFAILLSLFLLLSGIVLAFLGIGFGYMSQMLLEIKDRPLYIIKSKLENR